MTRQAKRNRLIRWLRELFFLNNRTVAAPQRVVRAEPLEQRQLLAGDGLKVLLASYVPEDAGQAQVPAEVAIAPSEAGRASIAAPLTPANVESPTQPEVEAGEGETLPEGEEAPDLVAFARALADSGTRFFGAAWCPACEEQRRLFEDGAQFLPFEEVTDITRQFNNLGVSEGIDTLPTWEFPDGSRLTGIQSLQTLSEQANVTIPVSSIPSVVDLPDVEVLVGSPLHVPIDAYDPSGDPLTITVTSSNPNVISAETLTGNRSLVINTEGFGDMVFELFEQRAPLPTSRIIELAEAGFYDGIIWHRVVNNFVIQGGDPTGSGSGGSTLGDFDDQYHLDLQHNRTGILSYAKTNDDTNDSQFFVTEGATRNLDFNHSIFGQLVEGEAVREALSNVRTTSSRPGPFDIGPSQLTMESVRVIEDNENGIVFLRANATSGTSTITVTIQDDEGNSIQESFEATIGPDDELVQGRTVNTAPFFEQIDPLETQVDTPLTFNLPAIDREGDSLLFSVQAAAGSPQFGLELNDSTGAVTITPPQGFTGQLQFNATVGQTVVSTTNTGEDNQLFTVQVTGTNSPTSLNLDASSDSGLSDDNITNATALSFTVNGTIAGALVEIRSGGNVVGSATATGTTTTVQVFNATNLGEGSIAFTAQQTVDGVASDESPALSVVLDRTGPSSVTGATIPGSQLVDTALDIDLQHPEEGQGLSYGLANAPAGMQLSTTGQLTWTPNSAQLGEQSFELVLSDAAGNETRRTFNINVIEDPLVNILPVAVDTSGNPLSSLSVGDVFRVQVQVQDLRNVAIADGVFEASYDLLFDPSVVEPTSSDAITFVDPYLNRPEGTVGDGIIDEVSAFSDRTSPIGNDIATHAEIEFRAIAAGNPNIRLDPNENTLLQNLVYGSDDPIPSTQVNYGSLDLQVGVDFEVNNDVFNFDEDSGQQTLSVLDNDSNNTNLTITSVGERTSGAQVTISSDGRTLLYTPAANFNGGETFTYRASNPNGVELEATVTVQVTDVNDPPLALNDTFSVFSGSNNNILEVLDNDSVGVDDANSETLRVTAVSAGSNGGSIVLSTGGLSVNYSPATGFEGTETFTYTLSDGRGGEATGTVSVEVSAENPPPVAGNDNFTVNEDDPQATFDVLQNDTTDDPNETLSVVEVGNSQRGSLFEVSSDGQSVVYQPAANFSGTEILSYTVRDSGGAETQGAVTFTVNAVNDPPIAVDDAETVIAANATSQIDVLANDSTIDDGETLTVQSVTQPASGNGTVEVSSDGQSVVYRPPSSDFEGTVTFTYVVSDGNGLTAEADVTLTVEDFLPRAISGTVTSNAGTGSFGRVNLQLSGTDITGATVSRQITSNADGSFEFTELAPGDYDLQRDPLPFLNDAGQTIRISSAVTDGDAVADVSVDGSLRPQHFDIRDFLGSTFANSILVAVDPTGSTSWSAGVGEWSTADDLTVDVQDDEVSFTISNAVGEVDLEGTLNVGEPTGRAYVSGQENGFRLIRVRGTPEDAGLAPPASEASNDDGAGEGEASPVSAPQIQSVSVNTGDIDAEVQRRRRPLSSVVDQAIEEGF